METQTRWAKVVLRAGVAGAALLPVSALGSRFGLWPFTLGFLLLLAGVLLAVLVVSSGVVGLVLSARRGSRTEYPAFSLGIVLGVLTVGVFVAQISGGLSAPAIHNISTDLEDPPAFQVIAALRDGANPYTYDASQRIGDSTTLGELQRSAYPDLTTLRSDLGVAEAVDRAMAVLEDMGLEVVNVDSTGGLVEATATTVWFGFKDDVVVRLRARAGQTLVDVHSVSRVGQGDLGANARRIMMFLDRFAAR